MEEVDSRALVLNENMMISSKTVNNGITVSEIYLDGKLNKAELTDDNKKSFGIFMHSLILSSSNYIMKVDRDEDKDEEIERAIANFTVSKGFDKSLIESIAPRVVDLNFERNNNLKVSTHLINGNLRFVTRGTPDELLKRCTYILMESRFVKLTRRIFREINEILKSMLNRGLTVFALGIKDLSGVPKNLNPDIIDSNVALVALVGVGKGNSNIRS